jgi:lycopene beta-cyclase
MALERLEKAANVELRRGVSVDELRPAAGGVVAVTSGGEVRARQAFDGRPPPAPAGGGTPGEIEWVQHFVGLEVETEEPAFDPSVATLMDFRRPGREGGAGPAARGASAGATGGPAGEIRFMYVLPFDERRALLEDTFFGGEPRDEGSYVDAIDAYLDERLGAGRWRELHRERGAIPMRTTPAAAPWVPRVTAIGVRAGLARPSTGYAFLAIQRQASRLAAHLALEGLDRTPSRHRPYGRAATFLDRVFLSYLEREPGAAPALFRDLFAGVAPLRLARFMFDGGTPADRLAVMRALPAGPLTRQALRELGPAARDLFRRS